MQCTRLDFDRDDKLVITWLDSERQHVPLVHIDVKNECLEESDNNNISHVSADEEQDERRTKADLKKELAVIYDVDDWMAKCILSLLKM